MWSLYSPEVMFTVMGRSMDEKEEWISAIAGAIRQLFREKPSEKGTFTLTFLLVAVMLFRASSSADQMLSWRSNRT